MKAPRFFKLPYDFMQNANKEKLDDYSIKYNSDDGSYMIAYYTQYVRGNYINKYIKYEKDGSQKEYDYYRDLTKNIGADGTVLEEFKYNYDYAGRSRDYHIIYDILNKKTYLSFGHYDNGYYTTEGYFCVEKEFENGCKRAMVGIQTDPMYGNSEHPYFQDFPTDASAWMGFLRPSIKGITKDSFIKEVYADGTRRFYKLENLEIADKFMESGWDEAQQYRKIFPLIYEILPNGTKRKYQNGYVEMEEVPGQVKREWQVGVLQQEEFTCLDELQTVTYNGPFVTTEKRPDGTVCTFYKGKLISENRPNGTHNTVTSTVDENGFVKFSFPEGQIMFRYNEGRYERFARNGKLKTTLKNGVTSCYDPDDEHNTRLYSTGWEFVVVHCDFENLKKEFNQCMAEGDMENAVQTLKLMCIGTDKISSYAPEYRPYDGISMLARNCLEHTQIKVLNDRLVAFGAIFEDRHFVKQSFSGGIEWYWRAVGIVLDIENGGVVAKCETPRLNVRDRFDPNKDKWKHIDTSNFMDVTDGKLTVRLGEYETASCDINLEKYNQFLEIAKEASRTTRPLHAIQEYIEDDKVHIR